MCIRAHTSSPARTHRSTHARTEARTEMYAQHHRQCTIPTTTGSRAAQELSQKKARLTLLFNQHKSKLSKAIREAQRAVPITRAVIEKLKLVRHESLALYAVEDPHLEDMQDVAQHIIARFGLVSSTGTHTIAHQLCVRAFACACMCMRAKTHLQVPLATPHGSASAPTPAPLPGSQASIIKICDDTSLVLKQGPDAGVPSAGLPAIVIKPPVPAVL